MKLVCIRCGKITDVGSRWCSNLEAKCPPDTLSLLFDPGETIQDFQITKLRRLFPMAALYEAKRGKQTVLLKIAHRCYEENLKREARLLQQIGTYPTLPTVMEHVEGRAYFKITVAGESKYCLLYEYRNGLFLDELLRENLQMDSRLAAWIVIQLADAVALLNVKHKKAVLNVRTDSVLVAHDKSGVLRPTLFDLGFALGLGERQAKWRFVDGSIAYTAPEIIRGEVATPQTDVYGLAVLLYELFSGQPAVPHVNVSHEQVREAVLQREPVSLAQHRPEFLGQVLAIMQQAIQKSPRARQQDARTFAKQLRAAFGEVPAQPAGFHFSQRAILSVIIVLFVLAMLFLLLVLIQPQ